MFNPFRRKSRGDTIGSMAGIDGGAAMPEGGKPKAGETTGPQNVGIGNANSAGIGTALYQNAGGGPLAGPGGIGNLGGVFPGGFGGIGIDMNGWGMVGWGGGNFIQPRRGTYGTYRIMGMDPTFALVRTLTYSPIIASQWTVQAADGIEVDETGKTFTTDPTSGRVTKVPKWAIDFISQTILPQRSAIIREALRYVEFGFRPFERVYELSGGAPGGGKFYTLKKLKPILPEYAGILHDDYGNFGGLTTSTLGGINTGGTNEGNLAPNKSWICSHEVEAGNLYGLSVYEAGYEPWMDIQRTRMKQLLLMSKISGILPTLYYRPGKTLINNVMCDNYDVAKQIIATAVAGGGMCVPTTEYSDSDLQENPDLSKSVAWRLDFMDAGSYAPAMTGMIGEREYQNKLQVRAWGWPERAVLEAQSSGSRADSMTHSQSASLLLENLDDDIAAQVSQGQPMYGVPGVIDELLRLNCGDGTEGSIILRPAPLADPKVDLYGEIIQTLLKNPAIAPILAQAFDLPDMLDHLDISTAEDFREKLPELLKEMQQAAMKPPAGAAGKPGAKPTGRMAQGDDDADVPSSQNGNGKHLSRFDRFESGAMLLDRSVSVAEPAKLTGGEWKTIAGAHVYIKDGVVVAGAKGMIGHTSDKPGLRDEEGKYHGANQHLIGKTEEGVESHGKASPQASPGYHAIERDATGAYKGTKQEDGSIKHVQEHADRLKETPAIPGHTDVQLSHDPDANVPVKGKDAKGKWQGARSDKATAEAKKNKFSRNDKFHEALPAIRERIEADMGGKNAEEAAVLNLMDKTGFRIGGDEDTGAKVKAYGASTLRAEHVSVNGDEVRFQFVGKKGVAQDHTIRDAKLAADIKARSENGGELFHTNDAKTRNYLHSIGGGQHFKNHDFRTEVATETGRNAVQSMHSPTSLKELKAARKEVAEVVSKKLGNNASEAQKSYINPAIYKSWHAKVAANEQADLIAAHGKANGLNEIEAYKDWRAKGGAESYRARFNKTLGIE